MLELVIKLRTLNQNHKLLIAANFEMSHFTTS